MFFGDEALTGLDDAGLTRFRRAHVGFIFQFYNLVPSLTAEENVRLVTDIAGRPLGPSAALDSATGICVLEALVHINRERGTTLVIITHNSAIAGIADRVLHFLDGRIARIAHNASPIGPAGIVW